MMSSRSSLSSSSPKTKSASPSNTENEDQLHSWLNIVYRTTNACLMVSIGTIVLYFQIKNRPMVSDIYYTSDPWDNIRGGAIYTCGCTLPTSLQALDDLGTSSSADSRKMSLNVCYDMSSLETVTILMYSNSSAAKVEGIIGDCTSDPLCYNKTVESGYIVNQEAHDITNYADSKSLLKDLKNLTLGGYPEDDLHLSPGYFINETFTSFPMSYVRLSFKFICKNCTSCALELVNRIVTKVVDKGEVWANCFYYSLTPDEICNATKGYWPNSYVAKCVLYPTEALPTTFAVKRFFTEFSHLHSIQIIRQGDDPRSIWENISNESHEPLEVKLEPSFLYLNISSFEQSPIQFGFVEVPVGSALWVSLSTTFRHLDTHTCSALKRIEICNGTSVCSLFSNVDSYYLRNMDWRNSPQCRKIMESASLDNYQNNTADVLIDGKRWSPSDGWEKVMCRSFTCNPQPTYNVIWKITSEMKDDALNQFLYSRIQDDEWAQRSGLCKINYTNVFRYVPPAETIMFLYTTCSSSNNNISNSNLNDTGKYCWLTGDYQFFNDTPEDQPKKLPPDLFSEQDRSFVCYRVEIQDFVTWFIVTAGILFGWLGTVQLILSWFALLATKIFRKSKDDVTSSASPLASGAPRVSLPKGIMP